MGGGKENRSDRGYEVRIGNRIFKSLVAAGRHYGTDSYVESRIRYHKGLMPDGTPIEVNKKRKEIKEHFNLQMTNEEIKYLEWASDRLGVTKAWVMMKLFHYGKEQLEAEMNKKKAV